MLVASILVRGSDVCSGAALVLMGCSFPDPQASSSDQAWDAPGTFVLGQDSSS